MRKVEISKEVAKAIEDMREIGLSSYGIAKRIGHKQGFGSSGLNPHLKIIEDWIDDGSGRGDDILTALVNGYEIEKSPQDKVREYYSANSNAYTNTELTRWLFDGRRQGVVETLNILGVRIEGIND